MTSRRVALVLAAAVVVASASVSTGKSSTPIHREVLVAIDGRGTVTSSPRGITCPRTCRARFPRDILMHLVGHPAAGWRLAAWSGYCTGKTCAFHLTTPHDCPRQLCSIGVFGVRVLFVRR
jgi:hypothetical protein